MYLRGIAGLAAGLVLLCLAGCAGSMRAAPPRSASDLLFALKAVADRNALFDPQETARLLALTLKDTRRHAIPSQCGHASIGWDRTDTDYVVAAGWYPVPPGGDPGLAYSASTTIQKCGVQEFLATATHARLELRGLPGFGCITPDMIVWQIGGQYRLATEGVSVGTYGNSADDVSTNIFFTFRPAARCAAAVSIRQDNDRSPRLLRAILKFHACTRAPENRHRQAHPASSAGAERDRMVQAAIAACGSLQSFYDREPRQRP